MQIILNFLKKYIKMLNPVQNLKEKIENMIELEIFENKTKPTE